MAINGKKLSLHRVFILLSIIWALYVLIVLPVQQLDVIRNNALKTYELRLSEAYNDNDPDRRIRILAEAPKNYNYEYHRSSIQYFYANDFIKDIHWYILDALILPLLLYGIVWSFISLVKWL